LCSGPMSLTPAQRALRARLGGLTTASRGHVNTAAARAAFLDRFAREIDPEGLLSPDERERRASAARKAHFARLALASSLARSKKRARPDRKSDGPMEAGNDDAPPLSDDTLRARRRKPQWRRVSAAELRFRRYQASAHAQLEAAEDAGDDLVANAFQRLVDELDALELRP
jgi:hypothetical protein